MRRLQDLLSQNGALKAAALTLAVLLWTAVRIDSPNERVLRDVPVTVELTDRDWTVRTLPAPVTVRFEGPTRDLLRLSGAQASIVVPIDEVASPDTTVVIEREWIRTGARSVGSISDVTPAVVRLSFDPVETRDAEVRVLALGAPPEGFSLAAAPTTVPRAVRVRGPAEMLRDVREVILEPLSLEDFTETTTVMRAVDRARLGALVVQPDSVSVVLSIEERVERTFAGVPVFFQSPPPSGLPPTDTVSVTVRGARTVVGRLGSGDFRVVAARPESGPDTLIWRIRVEGLPEWVEAAPRPARLMPSAPAGGELGR